MATKFPAETQKRLWTLLNLEPEYLLPTSELKTAMDYVETLESQGATGIVDVIIEALDALDIIDSDIQTANESGSGAIQSYSAEGDISITYRPGSLGDSNDYLRQNREAQVALIEKTLNFSAQTQGDFSYA